MVSLGLSFRVVSSNIELQLLSFKNFFQSLKPTNIGVDSFKKLLQVINYFKYLFLKSVLMLTQYYDYNLIFLGIQF